MVDEINKTTTVRSFPVIEISDININININIRVSQYRNMSACRLVALDLDGTTLNSDHRVTPFTIETLQKLSKSGVLVCIATGRSMNSVIDLLVELNLPQENIPIVAFNGAVGLEYCTATKVLTTVFLRPVPEGKMTDLHFVLLISDVCTLFIR